jgi:hypothetical protein
MIIIPNWLFALMLYISIIYLLITLKPPIMFDANGKPKEFGIGTQEGKSVLAPVFVFPVLAILCYFISSMIEFVLT